MVPAGTYVWPNLYAIMTYSGNWDRPLEASIVCASIPPSRGAPKGVLQRRPARTLDGGVAGAGAHAAACVSPSRLAVGCCATPTAAVRPGSLAGFRRGFASGDRRVALRALQRRPKGLCRAAPGAYGGALGYRYAHCILRAACQRTHGPPRERAGERTDGLCVQARQWAVAGFAAPRVTAQPSLSAATQRGRFMHRCSSACLQGMFTARIAQAGGGRAPLCKCKPGRGSVRRQRTASTGRPSRAESGSDGQRNCRGARARARWRSGATAAASGGQPAPGPRHHSRSL